MRRILLSVALLVASLALFLAFYDGGSTDSSATVPGRTEEDSSATPSAGRSDELPIADASELGSSARTIPEGELADAREMVGSLRVVTGKVAVSAACAADDQLRVYAWSEEVRYRSLQLMSTTTIGESLDNGAILLGSSSVNLEDSYRLELLTDLDEVHLYVRGRFAYSEEGHLTRVSERESKAYLATMCGACIEGELLGMGKEDHDEIEIELVSSSRQTGRMLGGSDFGAQSTHPDTDGRFTFAAVPTDRSYEVRVEPQELAPDLIDVVPLARGETRTVRLELRPGARISGRVVGPDGLPVPDARVRTMGGRAVMALAGWTNRENQTDESGEFSFVGLPSGEVVVVADREGYLDSGFKVLQLRQGEELKGLELVLSEGNSIAGTVRWPDGEPVAGALVEVEFDRSALIGADSINAARGGMAAQRPTKRGGSG
jgi:hypothetical protein